MAKKPQSLPKGLRGQIFTTSVARSYGVGTTRLRCKDLTNLRRGFWAPADLEIGELDPLRALVATIEGSWISHATAARFYGLPLPGRAENTLHISTPAGIKAPDRKGVAGHQRAVLPNEVKTAHGTRLSTPERVFIELAQILTLDELICAGDSLVRHPRPNFENGRSKPWTTIKALRDAVDRHPGKLPHYRKLQNALELIRVGSDSAPETRCRLAVVRAGIPEPKLQFRLNPNDPSSPIADQAIVEAKAIIQYDGAHHFTAESQLRDSRRDAAFREAGWVVIWANVHDDREGYVRIINHLKYLLQA